jgi:hypothetical protein
MAYSCIVKALLLILFLTGGSTLYNLARHSTHKAGMIISPEGKAVRIAQNVLVYVNGRNIFAVLLDQRQFVSLSDEALCATGVIATAQLYCTAEERLEILTRMPSTLSTKAV